MDEVRSRQARLGQARRSPPREPRQGRVEFGLKGAGGRSRLAQPRLAPARSVADSVQGLTRLKRKYVLATLSNGNVALMVNMARRAGTAVGRHSRRRGDSALQAAARLLSGHRGLPRSSSPPRSRWWPRTMATSPPRAPWASRPASSRVRRARPRPDQRRHGRARLGLHRARLRRPSRRARLLI